uniref:Protein phosphatase 1 regulatory subunit 35 n=1 Tax=Globodera pallida TaxID=36090 RepID=A0A183BJN8_GLOPA
MDVRIEFYASQSPRNTSPIPSCALAVSVEEDTSSLGKLKFTGDFSVSPTPQEREDNLHLKEALEGQRTAEDMLDRAELFRGACKFASRIKQQNSATNSIVSSGRCKFFSLFSFPQQLGDEDMLRANQDEPEELVDDGVSSLMEQIWSLSWPLPSGHYRLATTVSEPLPSGNYRLATTVWPLPSQYKRATPEAAYGKGRAIRSPAPFPAAAQTACALCRRFSSPAARFVWQAALAVHALRCVRGRLLSVAQKVTES